jgi:hypothetical protein
VDPTLQINAVAFPGTACADRIDHPKVRLSSSSWKNAENLGVVS